MPETTEQEFPDTPAGWADRWKFELKEAKEKLKEFHAIGREVDKALRDENMEGRSDKRLCLFPADMQTVGAMLFGRTPQASVSRKFADANDDEARVAAEMMERVLNCDIQRADDTFSEATKNAMSDWLGPGLGVQRHRYEIGPMVDVPEVPAQVGPPSTDPVTGAVVPGKEMAPAIPAHQKKSWERVNTDWVPWDEFLWGQDRTWDRVPWMAFLAKMPMKELIDFLGEEEAKKIPMNSARHEREGSREKAHPWDRADVWEVWHKESKQVFFVVDGHPTVLRPIALEEGDGPGQVAANGGINDPLELEGFWPCQKPMFANLTTSKLIPVASYKYAQDLYKTADVLLSRIDKLVKATRVTGAYKKEAGSIIEQLVDGGENKLYPVDSEAMFGEQGLRGVIEYLPLEQIVSTLNVLKESLRETIDLIYQVTGRADIMRGQQTQNGTPGEAQVKAKFGSARMQAMQDEIARFASDGQRIRAEIISRHFDPETIVAHSNIERTPDAQYAQSAVALIKSRFADYRIEVKPEAINLTDFAALMEERFEVLKSIGAFFGNMMPAAQAMGPGSMPFMLQMLQVSVAGLRGASAYESVLDQWIAQAKKDAEAAKAQAANGPPPDPKVQAAQMKMQSDQMKAQADLAKVDKELQADVVRSQMAIQENEAKERAQATWNVKEAAQKQIISNALKPPAPPKPGGIP